MPSRSSSNAPRDEFVVVVGRASPRVFKLAASDGSSSRTTANASPIAPTRGTLAALALASTIARKSSLACEHCSSLSLHRLSSSHVYNAYDTRRESRTTSACTTLMDISVRYVAISLNNPIRSAHSMRTNV